MRNEIKQLATLKPDWLENRINQLLASARRSGFFADVIDDAKSLMEDEGYRYDVALAISCKYWCS